MKQRSKYVRVIRRIKDYINSLSKRKPSYQTRKRWGYFVLLATCVPALVGFVHVALMILGKADPAHFGLWYMSAILLGFSGLMYFSIGVYGHSASPRVRLTGKKLAYLIVHGEYVFCIGASFFQLTPNLASTNKAQIMPSVCLLLLNLAETTSLFLHGRDLSFGLERGRPSRWWIRTTPYPVIGLIFLLFLNLWSEDHRGWADFSLFFSVAASMLAVQYLSQIINERIVPREGPYKKTYMAVYNRSIHARPTYHRPFPRRAHARRSKPSSPSAGRGEGAC